ncbi:MAG: hypothetical protein MUO39_01650 [Steroidobacteraceae bacterium]|nr:hypothetical protein [Steroidobacteraceae bacterium]
MMQFSTMVCASGARELCSFGPSTYLLCLETPTQASPLIVAAAETAPQSFTFAVASDATREIHNQSNDKNRAEYAADVHVDLLWFSDHVETNTAIFASVGKRTEVTGTLAQTLVVVGSPVTAPTR